MQIIVRHCSLGLDFFLEGQQITTINNNNHIKMDDDENKTSINQVYKFSCLCVCYYIVF